MENLWSLALLGLLLGPVLAAVVYGVRRSDSGHPAHDDTLDAAATIQTLKDASDLRAPGRLF